MITQIKPGTIAELSPSEILLDPKRFQYKLVSNRKGGTGSLANVAVWNPDLAGMIQVWQDPADGNTYAVNGHNRVERAQQLEVESITSRYIAATTAADARAIGALINIAESKGTLIDAAQFFRDTGYTRADLIAQGIPMSEKLATSGLAIAQLAPHLFERVRVGDLSVEYAAIIGASLSNPASQSAIATLLETESKNGRILAEPVVRELVKLVDSSPTVSEAQATLFGETSEERNLAIIKASVLADLRSRINSQKRIFNTVSRPKTVKILTEAGNVIKLESNRLFVKQANAMLARLDQVKYINPFSDSLNAAVLEIVQGGDKETAISKLMQQLES